MRPLLPLLAACAAVFMAAAPLQAIRVCATTPDIGAIVEAVGGEAVDLTVFAGPTEDPHYVEPRPSFVKATSRCSLFVQTGLELEIGWAPVLLNQAANRSLKPGGRGHLDLGTLVTPLQVPEGPINRSMGDVHASGSPHYLLDPYWGLVAADAIAGRLKDLDPGNAAAYASGLADFRSAVGVALVGPTLAAKYDPAKLALLFEHDRFAGFLAEQGDLADLGGWLGDFLTLSDTSVVDDHDTWPYLANRFRLEVVGHLEPKPGVPPTTRHLQTVVRLMEAQEVKAVLASPYFDPRHARFVSERTGAVVLPMAHMPGSRQGVDSYVEMIGHNVRLIFEALEGSP